MMPRIFLLTVTLALAATASAEIYKWTDDDGNTHYSDKPPKTQAEVLDIKSDRTDPERIAKLIAPPQPDPQRDVIIAAEEEREQIEAERQETRVRNCERAQKAYNSLLSATRIYEPLPDGERRYLDEDEVEQRKTAAQADIDQWCSNT